MSLSSNSLFHFTPTPQSLVGILTENFKVKYCIETILTQSGILNYAIPMVSFCDIPMSGIKTHIGNYGSYGIGLSKEWGQRNNLNPVFYIDKNSSVGKSYHDAFKSIYQQSGKTMGDLTDIEANLLDTVRYMKNHEADLSRNGKIDRDYRFADEKEWRYVPSKALVSTMVIKTDLYIPNKKEANGLLSELRLSFEPSDIKYVIIKSDHEISKFINVVRESKGTKYTHSDVERLMTRIITVDQITDDF